MTARILHSTKRRPELIAVVAAAALPGSSPAAGTPAPPPLPALPPCRPAALPATATADAAPAAGAGPHMITSQRDSDQIVIHEMEGPQQ